MGEDENFKHIIRVVNTDLDGSKPIVNALRKIYGVSFMFANMVCSATGVDKTKKAGTLSDDEVKKLEDAINNPLGNGAPAWMLNRRNDYETGEDKHITTADLKFIKDNDIKMMKKFKTYRGIRHMDGLPVRGQKTKSNFRKNKGNVTGVKKRPGAKSGK